MVSLAKKGLGNDQKLAKLRLLKKSLGQKAVAELFVIAEVVKERKSGFLRIIKLPSRKSDFAPMAKVEWVDNFDKKIESKGKKEKQEKGGENKKTVKQTQPEVKAKK